MTENEVDLNNTVPASSNRQSPGRRRALLILGPALVAGVGGYYYLTGGRFVDTENAYIHADKALVGAEVSGQISRVLVRENRRVEPGQALFQLDQEPFRIALARTDARLQIVRSEIKALKASYRQKQEELELALTNVAYFRREHRRQATLAEKKIISEVRLDKVRHDLDVAQRRVAVLRQDLSRTLAQLGGDLNLPVESNSRYREAEDERNRAALDLRRTTVVAPIAGIASNRPEPGEYAAAGSPIMSVVADTGVWVEANFKETELTHVRPGQPVTVRVDTYPDREWSATVDSIAQATGAEFSLLPPQNATGNWVKVVQRIPVRVAIKTGDGDQRLRAGMSVMVTIDTGHQRKLPNFLRTALSWVGTADAAPQTGMEREN